MKSGPKIRYTDKHHTRARQASQKWRKAHPELVKAAHRKWYESHIGYGTTWRRKNVASVRERERQTSRLKSIQTKGRLVDIFGGKCFKCGYCRCIKALEFHHRDTAQKLFEVSGDRLTKKSLEDLIAEAKKCDLLCANCHREVHYLPMQIQDRM